jgi:large conductance mechanosensitive channel
MVKQQLSEFKKFILRGNVVDLAVGVAIGAAFSSVVTALVKDFITPLIGTVPGIAIDPKASFALRGEQFMYGDFLNVLISFIITAAVIFFFIVQPVNKLTALANKGKGTEDPSTKKCMECLSEIPKDARRCKFCASEQPVKDKSGKEAAPVSKPAKPITSLGARRPRV